MRFAARWKGLFALMGLGLAAAATGADTSNHKTADGLSVYLGVLPSAMIQKHEAGHPEATMHDGVSRGKDTYHVVVAIFDVRTGQRVEDASVVADVTPLGLSPVRKSLEAMQIAGTTTYGNYFTMRDEGRYQISVSISRPGLAAPVKVDFDYQHFTQ